MLVQTVTAVKGKGEGYGVFNSGSFYCDTFVAGFLRQDCASGKCLCERLGAYQGTWSVGLHIKVPLIDKVAKRINLKEQVVDFAPQPVITKDARFYINENNNPVIVFEKYEIAPGSSGSVEFEIVK